MSSISYTAVSWALVVWCASTAPNANGRVNWPSRSANANANAVANANAHAQNHISGVAQFKGNAEELPTCVIGQGYMPDSSATASAKATARARAHVAGSTQELPPCVISPGAIPLRSASAKASAKATATAQANLPPCVINPGSSARASAAAKAQATAHSKGVFQPGKRDELPACAIGQSNAPQPQHSARGNGGAQSGRIAEEQPPCVMSPPNCLMTPGKIIYAASTASAVARARATATAHARGRGNGGARPDGGRAEELPPCVMRPGNCVMSQGNIQYGTGE